MDIVKKGIGRNKVNHATHIINSGNRIELKEQLHKRLFGEKKTKDHFRLIEQ